MKTEIKQVISIIVFVVLAIITQAISDVIQETEWYNKLTGIMKILFQNIDLTIFLILTVLLVYLLLKWYIEKQNSRLRSEILELKNKIIALKKYRDSESIDMMDHMNKEIKKLENRCIKLEKKAEIHTDYELNENEKLAQKRELDTRKEKIIEYNSAFDNWKVGEYGKGTSQTMYKSFSEYETKKNK